MGDLANILLILSLLICGMRRVICLSADHCVGPDFRSLAVAEGSDSVDTGVTLVALSPWESPSVCRLRGVVCCWVSNPCLAQLEVQDYIQFLPKPVTVLCKALLGTKINNANLTTRSLGEGVSICLPVPYLSFLKIWVWLSLSGDITSPTQEQDTHSHTTPSVWWQHCSTYHIQGDGWAGTRRHAEDTKNAKDIGQYRWNKHLDPWVQNKM